MGRITNRRRGRLVAAVAVAAAVMAGLPAAAAAVEASATYRRAAERAFQGWLGELWPEARARGVSRATFDAAFAGVKLQWDIPDLAPPAIGGERPAPSRRAQAEFGSPGRYFPEASLAAQARTGRAKLAEHDRVLATISAATGVPKEVIVAIWGRETSFSGVNIPHDAVAVLATQAFMGRRPAFFRPELVGALEILERRIVPRAALKSSWAGAMGHTQMLPRLYLQHGRDGDGDGKVDIWRSIPDALATTAAYLAHSGWVAGLSWAYEVEPGRHLDCTLEGPDGRRPAAQWIAAGAQRVAGRQWPGRIGRIPSYLIMPAGRFGPAFIATDNYYALKAYNESDLYVLYVGNLADRIAGGGAFRTAWREVDVYSREEMRAVQERMVKLGYNVGDTIDGLVGFRTRTATGRHQAKLGLAVDCWPNRSFTGRLR